MSISPSERIRKYRKRNKCSLIQLSEATRISIGHLSDIENGKAPITGKSAQKLAKAMGLKRWWNLVTETPTKTSEKRQVA